MCCFTSTATGRCIRCCDLRKRNAPHSKRSIFSFASLLGITVFCPWTISARILLWEALIRRPAGFLMLCSIYGWMMTRVNAADSRPNSHPRVSRGHHEQRKLCVRHICLVVGRDRLCIIALIKLLVFRSHAQYTCFELIAFELSMSKYIN